MWGQQWPLQLPKQGNLGSVGRETCLVLETLTEGIQDTVSGRSDMYAKRGCGHIEMLA